MSNETTYSFDGQEISRQDLAEALSMYERSCEMQIQLLAVSLTDDNLGTEVAATGTTAASLIDCSQKTIGKMLPHLAGQPCSDSIKLALATIEALMLKTARLTAGSQFKQTIAENPELAAELEANPEQAQQLLAEIETINYSLDEQTNLVSDLAGRLQKLQADLQTLRDRDQTDSLRLLGDMLEFLITDSSNDLKHNQGGAIELSDQDVDKFIAQQVEELVMFASMSEDAARATVTEALGQTRDEQRAKLQAAIVDQGISDDNHKLGCLGASAAMCTIAEELAANINTTFPPAA